MYPLLALIAAVGIGFFYVKPTWTEIKGLQAQKTQFDNALSDAQEIKNTIERLNTKYNSISADELSRLETLMPEKIDITHALQNLNSIAEQYGVSIEPVEIVEQKPDENNPHLGKVMFSFDLYASYDQFKQITADIEKSLQLADIANLEVVTGTAASRAGAKNDEAHKGLTRFTYGLMLYTYKD